VKIWTYWVKKAVSPCGKSPFPYHTAGFASPAAMFFYPTELFFNHAEMGSMKVSSLILLERGEIVLYNDIRITVDLEVLRFLGAKIR
jgi:hypothetical protein